MFAFRKLQSRRNEKKKLHRDRRIVEGQKQANASDDSIVAIFQFHIKI